MAKKRVPLIETRKKTARQLEDEGDIGAARKSIADTGAHISWKDLKAELGVGRGRPQRKFGALKGAVVVPDSFFEPLPKRELAGWK